MTVAQILYNTACEQWMSWLQKHSLLTDGYYYMQKASLKTQIL